MAAPRVLLVGSPSRFGSLASVLRDSGEEVATETEVLAVPRAIRAFRPDVVVVAAAPGDVDTVTATCRRARALGDVPVVAMPDVHEACFCQAVLSGGVDDCVAATDPVELIATHVRRALVRRRRLAAPAVKVGKLVIDEASHAVEWEGRPLTLSSLEFCLLAELARHPGAVVRQADLLNHLWTSSSARNSLDQAVSRLRRKLGGACAISTVRGVGYVLCPSETVD